MKLRSISELQHKSGPRAGNVASSIGKYKRGSVNDLTDNPKSKPRQAVTYDELTTQNDQQHDNGGSNNSGDR